MEYYRHRSHVMVVRLHIPSAFNAIDLFMLMYTFMQVVIFFEFLFNWLDIPHRLINIISTQKLNSMWDVIAIKIALIAKY